MSSSCSVGSFDSGSSETPAFAACRLLEVVHRHDEHEVDDRGDGDEVDGGADDGADVERRLAPTQCGHVPDPATEIADLEDHPDERVDEPFDDGVDDRRERGADDDSDREVDDVAAHDEVFEALDHGSSGSPAFAGHDPDDAGEDFASDFDDVEVDAPAPAPPPEVDERESVR